MNEPILRHPEAGRLFWHLLAWPLVAVIQFCGVDVRGEANQQETLRPHSRIYGLRLPY